MKDKKVAIITWCDNNGPTNYGQILQCYAMQRIFEKLGFHVAILRYRRKSSKDFYRNKFRYTFLNRCYEFIYKVIVIEKCYSARLFHFRKFIRKNINLSKPCYDRGDLNSVTRSCDYLICGSDQIWNPIWFDPMYFLDFGKRRQKRIAYAPSGIVSDEISYTNLYQQIGSLINRIDYVSVREENSVNILKNYTNRRLEAVLDPTLILDRADWDKIASNRMIKEPYVFCYAMGSLDQHKFILKQVMKRHQGKKLLYIPSNLITSRLSYAVPCHKAGPAEFVALIKNAEAVCTDSFHGVALSIIYKKQFYIMRRNQANCAKWASISRMENIIHKLHLGVRMVSSVKDVKELPNIDYDQVDQYMKVEVNKSLSFLKKALK